MRKSGQFAGSLLLFTLLTCISLLHAQDIITFNVEKSKQTIDGFGGSIAYYENWLTAHPKRALMYDYLFKDLGISILRLRNSYMNEGGSNQGLEDTKLIVAEAKKRGAIDIMIASWSPPGVYKSNGKTANEGTMATLATDTSGNFVYDGFADWWYQSLLQYKQRGIDANYISIQNEPNFNPDYEGCIFMPQEQMVTDTKLDSTYKVASYATAFSAVYNRIDSDKSKLNIFPKMIGPEVIGIENAWSGRPRDYTQYMDMSKCYAVSHHLYTGGDEANPNTFISNLSQIAKDFPDKPKMQTEYYRGDWYATALLIHNSLVYENVSAYLVWDLFWPGGSVMDIENPWTPGSWINSNGFKAQAKYYVLKQYSAFIKPGWKRIDASNSSASVKSTAFISPDSLQVTLVMINTSTANKGVVPDPLLYNVTGGSIYRTSATENCILVGNYAPGTMILPPKSVTTLALVGNTNPLGNKTFSFPDRSLTIFPNPFVDEGILKISGFQLPFNCVVSNILGQEVYSGIVRNEEVMSVGRNLKPGIYILKLWDGENQKALKFEKQ
jgi:glucuronoarabinoxylan endo-1,4-beta-xylanase